MMIIRKDKAELGEKNKKRWEWRKFHNKNKIDRNRIRLNINV